VKTPIQDLHDAVEQYVARFVNTPASRLPRHVGVVQFKIGVSTMQLAHYGVVVTWEKLRAPIVVHVGNLKGCFRATEVASAPDVRYGNTEYTIYGHIRLEESSMSESTQEVEFRKGCPSVDHVEAALRLGLEWRCKGKNNIKYRFVINKGLVCLDCPPYAPDNLMSTYDDFVRCSGDLDRAWRLSSAENIPVTWSDLYDEVARFKATKAPPAPVAQPTKRFNVGDAVMCSTFSDGTAGVRIANPQDIARNLGVGKIEGCWQDHSRYQVRNLATDEVHVWPALALQGVDNWGLKIGDEVVTPRFGGAPSFMREMEQYVDQSGLIEQINNYIWVHGWAWPTYDVAVATARHRLKAAQVEAKAAAKQPEFRQLTRGIIEANPDQIWQYEGAQEGRFDKYRYVDGVLRSDFMSHAVGWSKSPTLLSCSPGEAYLAQCRPICAATMLPMSWDELKPSLDVAKPTSQLPRDGDAMTVDVAIAEEGARRAIERHLGAGTTSVRVYDNDADERSTLTNMLVEQGATDINIQRDSHGVLSATYKLPIKQSLSHIPQETTMPTINTGTTNGSTIDNPTTTTKKPSRGRLAIDAAKTRAPVELGLNRMHKIVAKKALKMFKGTRQEKAVVQRFLSDVLQSEYGKAFMGAAAATIVPYGASLPGLGKHADILDAVADELAKRSATVLAVELGGTLLDAVEPLIAIVTDMVAKTAEGSSSVEVVDMPAETARLSAPQQGSSPDFSNVASSMRCRTSA